MAEAVKVVFSNTYDLNDYHIEEITEEKFLELEQLRAGELWAVLEEYPVGSGYHETYHGPV